MASLTKSELNLIKDALESAQTEFEQLMLDEEWFVTEVVDLQESALEIVRGHLGLLPEVIEDE
jgi:hypothetical protein